MIGEESRTPFESVNANADSPAVRRRRGGVRDVWFSQMSYGIVVGPLDLDRSLVTGAVGDLDAGGRINVDGGPSMTCDPPLLYGSDVIDSPQDWRTPRDGSFGSRDDVRYSGRSIGPRPFVDDPCRITPGRWLLIRSVFEITYWGARRRVVWRGPQQAAQPPSGGKSQHLKTSCIHILLLLAVPIWDTPSRGPSMEPTGLIVIPSRIDCPNMGHFARRNSRERASVIHCGADGIPILSQRYSRPRRPEVWEPTAEGRRLPYEPGFGVPERASIKSPEPWVRDV